MRKLVIIGASGHGKVIADVAARNGYEEIVFLDDNQMIHACGRYPVVGRTADVAGVDADVIVGIGNADVRKRMQESVKRGTLVSLIHPNAVVADDVHIGTGTVIMAGAVVNSGASIGDGCIINTCSSVDHDCSVGNFVHIAVGSHLCGTVEVGDKTWIGTGATVSNNVRICEDTIIGAGAVVIKNIQEPGTYVGVPAKKVHKPLS